MSRKKPHEKLLGQHPVSLKAFAKSATHQHYKGGLYRDLGIALDADTKEPLKDERGPMRGWLHVYPYEESLILRAVSEDEKFTKL